MSDKRIELARQLQAATSGRNTPEVNQLLEKAALEIEGADAEIDRMRRHNSRLSEDEHRLKTELSMVHREASRHHGLWFKIDQLLKEHKQFVDENQKLDQDAMKRMVEERKAQG